MQRPVWVVRAAAALITFFLVRAPALACPDCELGRQVRARIMSENFWVRLSVAMLPLVVLAAIALVLYRIGLDRRQEQARDPA